MRATTLPSRILKVAGASVRSVKVEDDGTIVVWLRRRATLLRCPSCDHATRARYDRREGSWRHLDLARTRVELRCEVRRLCCPTHGVVSERLAWARPGSRFTRDFEDVVAHLAREAPKSCVAELMRISWPTVGRIIERVVFEQVSTGRLEGLYRIGIDEVAYRKGHRYLTCVADHDRPRIVWAEEGKSAKTLGRFFTELGPTRCQAIAAISIDMSGAWQKAIQVHAPQAAVCFDPFHVAKLAGDALDALRRAEWQRLRKLDPDRAVWMKGARFALRRRPELLRQKERDSLAAIERHNKPLYRGYLIKEQLRAIYATGDPQVAEDLLRQWLSWAQRSRLAPFVKLARTIRAHFDGIRSAIRLGLSNARLEGLNSTVRLISHRARGFGSAQAILAMIQLRCGGIVVELPT